MSYKPYKHIGRYCRPDCALQLPLISECGYDSFVGGTHSGSITLGKLVIFLKDNPSPDAIFPEYEDEVARARSGLRRTAFRRVPAGTALRLMIAASLLLWITLIVLFLRFFA